MRVIGCTAATGTHLAGAQVAAASWRQAHPEAPFRVLLADGDRGAEGADAPSVILPEDLGLEPAELAIRRGLYNPFEYVTSLKAHLLRHLLRTGADAVVFTDADTRVYGRLDALATAAAAHGVCLTAHVLRPLPRDGRSQEEMELLRMGVYNTGLLAVGRAAGPFLDWWAERLRRDCLDHSTDGFFVEQRWIDLVPTYFDHVLLRDPALNVAFWNLHERRVERTPAGFTVDGEPLRHVHFSGFDPAVPGALTKHPLTLPLRVTMADDPSVARLYADYAQELIAAGHHERTAGAYPFAVTAHGRPLGRWERLVYREAVLRAEACGTARPPDPFDPAQTARFDRLVDGAGASDGLSHEARARLRRARDALGPRAPRAPLDHLAARARRLVLSRIDRRSAYLCASDAVAAEYAGD